MNWKKLPKEKQKHLLLIVVFAIGALAGLWFGLINYQRNNLQTLARKKVDTERKRQLILDAIRQTERLATELAVQKKALAEQEVDLASGDRYAWVINTLRAFKADHKVDIPQLSQLSEPTDVPLLPSFPYKQATLSVAGTAHYHDLGRFLAEFENQFPHMRILNLIIDLNANPTAGEQETLAFRMDIVTLVKSNQS